MQGPRILTRIIALSYLESLAGDGPAVAATENGMAMIGDIDEYAAGAGEGNCA